MGQRRTPFEVMAAAAQSRTVLKVDVLAACAHLEDDALRDPPAIAVATVQDGRFANRRARSIWRDLARAGTTVAVFGREVPAYVTEGVPGSALTDDDPLGDVWAFVCLWADGHAGAMAGADAGMADCGPGADDLRRGFELVETEDSGVVRACLAELGVQVPG